MIQSRIYKLRQLMETHHMSIYIVPTADFHQSEYVGEYFKVRRYLSGFTGSAGTLIVTKEEAGLWTDGRYFIQAEKELKDTGIKLFRTGEEGVPTVEEYIINKVTDGDIVGFDGRVIDAKFGIRLEEKLKEKNATITYEEDLTEKIWENRPTLSKEPAFLLSVKYAGKTVKEKLSLVREKVQEKEATVHILTSLDDIAWLYNIRGNDVANNPVVLAYSMITLEDAYLFIHEETLNTEIKQQLHEDKVTIKPYDDIYLFTKQLQSKEKVLVDTNKVNYTIISSLDKGISCIDTMNPTTLLKAVKNEVEIEHLRHSHLKDGIAFTKFMYWLKTNIGKVPMTELSASDYLEECRKKQEGFIELSFPTICAYNANAAMMHYAPSKVSNAHLQPEGMLLVDSGGQYFDGTTDITRTMILGPISKEQKIHFTAVVRSMLQLADAKFLYGCRGMNLDILARGPIWELGLDYKCGTGHGVGFLLNVHESPNGFRWRVVPERNDNCVLEAGMVTTDEPGIYIENSHGIRIENELVCQKGEKNEYGQFMYFEPLTFAPIDLDGIDTTIMTKKEKELLNSYHQMVYEKLSPYMEQEEKEWLKTYTREV